MHSVMHPHVNPGGRVGFEEVSGVAFALSTGAASAAEAKANAKSIAVLMLSCTYHPDLKRDD